jgi:hypothetical protein
MPKKKKKSKKEERDLNSINPDEHLKETVALSILGRTLASYAAVLTNDEKSHYNILYQMIKANRKPSRDLPETFSVGKTPQKSVGKYTPTEAIKEFAERFPKEAQPLLAMKEEKHLDSRPTLNYGIREGEDLDHEYMIEILKRKLEITRGPARQLYEQIILPEFDRQREESGLVTITMKD